ncbi:hydrogenase formation protein HypD [Clostridium cylindrosporum]|uniref:Hydrogenase isoenzymes formation protein HypD n=1 Tax=Clostridium cylindrosporum DSM 605 TaxID=1121307 RepID=A0A0J8D848_CLOCY|nr:hydrogenase formation protein HypD [Clostridium cylindrosporum]KMT22235.1 hydrogenase isoenzymes formation protein HypD [Clostridium cylindrosporum DSM 605]
MDFNNIDLGKKIINSIHKASSMLKHDIKIMEICGTHTRSIYNYGIPSILPSNIKLISGPGCPICVTPREYIDLGIEVATSENVILATFSDVLRVPGSRDALSNSRSRGYDIRIVHSPLEALNIAKNNIKSEVVLICVGFETTAPSIALTLKKARESNIKNFSILNYLKTMPNALKSLILDNETSIDGFICPGHVGTIVGNKVFDNLARESNTPMTMCGFEAIDILGGIYSLINLIINKDYRCNNLYSRAVSEEGNILAKDLISEVFLSSSSLWRGIGRIENSGYELRHDYKIYDARHRFYIDDKVIEDDDKCSCKYIITGRRSPRDCIYFKRKCTPLSPLGPCMVSSEGACNIEYSYI